MASPRKKRNISVKKLLKFSGIIAVCIYAAFILVKQQVTLSAIEDTQAQHIAAGAVASSENQALQDELEKAESASEYIEKTLAEKEAQKKDAESENGEATQSETAPAPDAEHTSAEDEYIEQLIRERLGYVKPNERVFIDISRDK